MSIASEFDSTIENIKSDYEGLENLGADLTNVNKNIQNIRTCLDNIYSSLPKTTGEGSSLSLSPTLKGKLNIEAYKGNTEQETTNGYQLINPSTIETGTKTGITLSQTNGIITISGTATSYTAFNINVGEITGDKYLSCDNWGSFTIYTQYNGRGVGTITQNATFSTTIDKLVIGINNGVTINKTIKLMLEKGTTAHNWEQYTGGIASPNPTYPQDINVVTGTQEVEVSNKNLCNVNFNSITIAGVTLTKNSDNSITANGTAASVIAVNILNNNGGTAIDNLTLPKGTYTLSGCPTRWWY